MQRVTGIGGIFFKTKNPTMLREWYRRHLGIPIEEWGGAVFRWNDAGNPGGVGTTVWSPFEEASAYFAPSAAAFMINYRVADVRALVS